MKAIAVAALLALASGARAGDWPQLRGPHFDGSTDEKGLPASWSATTGVRWKTALPGPGSSTPAVVGDRVYVSAFDRATGQVVALGLDRKTGAERFRVPLGPGIDSRDRGRENTLASPSPIARGENSWFLAGNGTLVALDGGGAIRWRRDLAKEHGRFHVSFGYAASPLLHEDTLYVAILHRGTSRVLAMDPATGRDRWAVVRGTDAVAESQEAYTTPLPMKLDGRTWILVLGGDRVTAHDPATGRVAWHWAGYNPAKRENFRVVPSPVVAGDLLFVNAPQMNPLYALRITGSPPEVLWTKDAKVTDVPTPAVAGSTLVLVGDRQRHLTFLEASTGRVQSEGRLDLGTLRASPTVADGKVYLIDDDGEVRVYAVGDASAPIGKASVGGTPCHAAIVAAHGQLFVRTADALWCVGK